jgi:hypothetical protein
MKQRIIVIALIVVFVAALVFLYMNYTKQTDAREVAQQNLNAANASLNKATNDKKSIQNQLDQANSDVSKLQNQMTQALQNLANVKTDLPSSADSVDYDEILFDTANRFNVAVTSIATDKPATSNVDNVAFNTSMFQIAVKGAMPDVINYLYALATEPPFDYATITTLGITTNQETFTSTDAEGNEVQTTVTFEQWNVQITLYTYKG